MIDRATSRPVTSYSVLCGHTYCRLDQAPLENHMVSYLIIPLSLLWSLWSGVHHVLSISDQSEGESTAGWSCEFLLVIGFFGHWPFPILSATASFCSCVLHVEISNLRLVNVKLPCMHHTGGKGMTSATEWHNFLQNGRVNLKKSRKFKGNQLIEINQRLQLLHHKQPSPNQAKWPQRRIRQSLRFPAFICHGDILACRRCWAWAVITSDRSRVGLLWECQS